MNRQQRRSSKSPTTSSSGPGGHDPLADMLLQGQELHKAGKLADAEKIYKQILALNPQHAVTLFMLSQIAIAVRRYGMAEDYVQKAILYRPGIAEFYETQGDLFRTTKKQTEAVTAYNQAYQLKPSSSLLNKLALSLMTLEKYDEALALLEKFDSFDAWNNIGVIRQKQKNHTEAISCFKKALTFDPKSFITHNNLGISLMALEKTKDARAAFDEALKHNPQYIDPYLHLAKISMNENNDAQAIAFYRQALSLKPDGRTHKQLAYVLQKTGVLIEAKAEYEKALLHEPGSVQILNNLGVIHNALGNYEAALSYYHQALDRNEEQHLTYSNIGSSLKNLGRLRESIEAQKKALSIKPEAKVYSNLLLTMVYADFVTPEELSETARRFGEAIANPLMPAHLPVRDTNPDRPLKIGYVSPDLGNHAVSYFFEPVVNVQDDKNFEIFVYSDVGEGDHVTKRLKSKVKNWRETKTLKNEEVAALIETDQIDILVDIAGHTSSNRLMVFATKPAPIQVTWLGFPATTGMRAMDYRLTDPYAEPPGMTEHLNAETLWRLPEFFCCYQPSENSPDVIDHPPFEDNGYVTFGCFNNFTKVTDEVLRLWAEILDLCERSQLLLEIKGIHEPVFKNEIITRLTNAGLPMDRVILENRRPENQFVLYNKIDIALDPFPCNGGTTSMDALWMGVPVVTLAGKHFSSRMGVSLLTNAGMPELIAQDKSAYVEIATALAKNSERLASLRDRLRERVIKSPLMDQKAFVKNLGNAYRKMWHHFLKVV